jgi:hypothetical protein
MLAHQFKRHLAHNWKKLCRQTQEELAESNPGRVKVSFTFELDQSAPTVAAFTKIAMSFSRTEKTEGKAQSRDINQGDFFNEDLGDVLDTAKLETETAPPPEEPEIPPGSPAEGTPPAEGQPPTGDPPPVVVEFPAPPKRRRKNAVAKPEEAAQT